MRRRWLLGCALVSLIGGALGCFGGGEAPISTAEVATTASSEDGSKVSAETSPGAPEEASGVETGPLAHLEGHWGFVWTMEGERCEPFTADNLDEMVLDGAECTADPGKDLFGIRDEAHHRCTVGDHEWLVFRSEATCREMAAVHAAHGP